MHRFVTLIIGILSLSSSAFAHNPIVVTNTSVTPLSSDESKVEIVVHYPGWHYNICGIEIRKNSFYLEEIGRFLKAVKFSPVLFLKKYSILEGDRPLYSLT